MNEVNEVNETDEERRVRARIGGEREERKGTRVMREKKYCSAAATWDWKEVDL